MERLRSILLCLALNITFPLSAQEFTLLFAGDAMQHQSQIDNARRGEAYDYSSYFPYIEYEVQSADLAIVNLEVTLAGKPYKGYPQFSAPDEYAVVLKDAGFDIFLMANNHIVDRGNKGLIRTLNVLDSINIKHTGVFRDKDDRARRYPLIVEIEDGIRFALLNYTYGTNGLYAKPPAIVNYIDRNQISEDVQKAKQAGVDLIIANMHWGVEYKLIQNKVQESLADFLVDEGVDLIIGSHPHVVQPSKTIRDQEGNITNLIVYSLGNLISGMLATNTDGGQLIKVILEKTDSGLKIKSAGYMLVYRHKKKMDDRIDYQIIPVSLAEETMYPILGDDAIVLDADSYGKMAAFARNARQVLDRYNDGVSEYRVRSRNTNRKGMKFIPFLFGN